MWIEMRYYKRFDPDLLSLINAGVDLNAYLPEILRAYARGEEYHLLVPFCVSHDLNGQQHIHTRIRITDQESVVLLKNIKHGYRNSFCKVLIRDALVFQSLGVFFADQNLISKENARIHSRDISGLKNVVTAVAVRPSKPAVEKILGDGAIQNEKEKDKDEKKEAPVRFSEKEKTASVPEGPSLQEQKEALMKKLATANKTKEQNETPSAGTKSGHPDGPAEENGDNSLFDIFNSMLE